MVTPNCNTAVNALVIYETSFRKKLLPKLYNIDIPMLSKNNTGTNHESIVNDKTIKTTLVNMLRDELKKKEPNRDFLRFRYRGEICDGVPISEINPSKFIFKIDDKLRGVNLSEIKIL